MDPTKRIGKIKEQVELENISRRRYPDKWGKLTDKTLNRFYNQDEVNKILRTENTDNDENDDADKNVNKEILPFVYTGHGDSYFVSKDMFESLVAKCRCGRRRTEGHSIKCLQKVQSKYFNDNDDDDDDDDGASGSCRHNIGREFLSSSSKTASGDDDDGRPSSKNRNQLKHHDGRAATTAAVVTNDFVDFVQSSKLDGGSNNGGYSKQQRRHPVGKSRHHRQIPETSNGMIGWPKSSFSEWEQSAKYVSTVTMMHGHKITSRPYNVIFIG